MLVASRASKFGATPMRFCTAAWVRELAVTPLAAETSGSRASVVTTTILISHERVITLRLFDVLAVVVPPPPGAPLCT